jgi:hypothetical protein
MESARRTTSTCHPCGATSGIPTGRSYFAREDPPIAKYLIGAVLRVGGQRVMTLDRLGCFYLAFRDLPGAWGLGRAYEKRRAVVARMSPEVRDAPGDRHCRTIPGNELLPVRILMASLGYLVALGVYALGCRWCGPRTGMLASLIVAVHPVAVEAYTRAGSDIVALAFSVAAVALLASILRPAAGHPVPSPRGAGTGL